MKPTSPLSLLLFLRLSAAAPIPVSLDPLYPTDCQSKSCIISLLTSPESNHQPPPTHFTEPHFPEHQLEDDTEIPISTPSQNDASQSLSSSEPLSSSYLLSLTNPASKPALQKDPFQQEQPQSTTENLPAKPSSALAELRAADLKKYWQSLRSSSSVASPKNPQVHSCEMSIGSEMVGSEKFYYMRRTRLGTRRDYADLMVVGIVVLFLAVVVALEAVERCGDLGGILCGRRQRRGEIYLEDDETTLFVVRKPFVLSPPPASRNKISNTYQDEKEAFAYDSDANERV